jgi:hypothetical protein
MAQKLIRSYHQARIIPIGRLLHQFLCVWVLIVHGKKPMNVEGKQTGSVFEVIRWLCSDACHDLDDADMISAWVDAYCLWDCRLTAWACTFGHYIRKFWLAASCGRLMSQFRSSIEKPLLDTFQGASTIH